MHMVQREKINVDRLQNTLIRGGVGHVLYYFFLSRAN
jgi:hypothetical protein